MSPFCLERINPFPTELQIESKLLNLVCKTQSDLAPACFSSLTSFHFPFIYLSSVAEPFFVSYRIKIFPAWGSLYQVSHFLRLIPPSTSLAPVLWTPVHLSIR